MTGTKAYCQCVRQKNTGWTRDGADFVCANCKKPSYEYLKNVIIPRTVLGGQIQLDELTGKMRTFSERIDERIALELEKYAAEYNVPIDLILRLWELWR